MAVVQISRIQVRRGKKTDSDIPQLASGELGWAVDAQELYIGNGSVSEGAPQVGNTQVLTENDDIFQFAGTLYTYKKTDSSITTGKDSNSPVTRTLQERLDETVNAASFGVVPGQDVTRELQNALLQCFPSDTNNTNAESRVTLEIQPGRYTLSDTIYVPANAKIVGAGRSKTFFNTTAETAFEVINDDAVVTIDWSMSATDYTSVTGNGLANTNSVNAPTKVHFSDLEIRQTGSLANFTGILFEAANSCTVKNVKVLGSWSITDSIDDTKAGIIFTTTGLDNGLHHRVEGCVFSELGYAIKSDYELRDAHFNDNYFYTNGKSIVFGEVSIQNITGPSGNHITNSKFEQVSEQAIHVVRGSDNVSSNNTFVNCGNDGAADTSMAHPVIHFESNNNRSTDDWFSRSNSSFETTEFLNIPYIPEVKGSGFHTQRRNHFTTLIENLSYTSFVDLIRIPADQSRQVIIDYTYRSLAGDAQRAGQLKVFVNRTSNTIDIHDESEVNGGAAFDGITGLPKLRFQSRYDNATETAFVTFTNFLDERLGGTYEGANFNYTLTYVN